MNRTSAEEGVIKSESQTVATHPPANGEGEAEGVEIDDSMVAQRTIGVREDARA